MDGYFDVVSYLMGRRALYGKMLDLYPTDTIENAAVASFPDGADGVPVKELKIAVTPVQAAGTPTPENPLPITGWTGANIAVSPTLDAQDGTTYPVSWQTEAGTVYGGTLEWLGGKQWKLRVTHTIFTIPNADSGTLGASSYGTHLFAAYSFMDAPPTEQGDFFYGERCSWITYADRGEVWKGVIGLAGGKLSLYIWIPADSTAESVNTALAGSKIVYPIATPVEYTITASDSEIKTLLGDNNIFADCGNILKLVYRADVEKYIEKKLSEGTE